MNAIQNVSRRSFLQTVLSSGALVLGASAVPLRAQEKAEASSRASQAVLHPSIFLGVETDGTVYIVAHRSEMGTGVRTSLPRIVADEMEADWNRVKVVQADGNSRYGSQDTDGSHSVREFFDTMREAGATAGVMLLQAAAQQWSVPSSECQAELHTVIHKPTARKLGYGELASAAAKLPTPKKEDLQFKPPAAWRYIGKDAKNYDVQDLCTGRPLFGMDIRRDGMVYAAIAHPPVLGGKVTSVDDKAALQVMGVKQTVAIEPFHPPHAFQALGGVAVIADNTFAAFKGRKNLKVVWDNGANSVYSSDPYKKQLQETARKPAKVVRNVGDVDAQFAKGGKVIEAEYYTPHLAHASMEPPVAVAEFRDGKVTVWAPTQNPQGLQETVAQVLGLKPADVTCHVTLLGGGFGRKSKPDYAVEAAILAKKTGRPVKVVWSREDDIQFDYYHSVAATYFKAMLDSNGKPAAWLQRSVFPPIGSTFALNQTYGGDGEMAMGWSDVPFDLPNHRAENGEASAHVRIGWLRSVANIYHAFGVQSFANELAYAAGRDPLEYLLSLIGPPRILDFKRPPRDEDKLYPFDAGRLRRVTELAAEKAGWGKRQFGKGTGLGIAAHRSFLTYVAMAVEVHVNEKGELRIPAVHTAVDAGTVVNPETVRAQFEGAAVFGTSIARSGEITATGGVVDQSNFHNYQVARMNQAPYRTSVHIIDDGAPPAGVGEPGVPPYVPALCNAIYAATGKRIRELPLSRNGIT